ncbi:hypothetical protein OG2516_13756 [Oceanicola granulosus HTCC2516]|uniref:General stress protein FMN-binding split barrel domain-containing protein n=1 Tax=Oceanicola granulosus (strain ATCC BAA-861 / DSM 15982 / KCTC 12143 / HTCC2516) TaxID=314256 RepID=Q2CDZ6_OCEGH|nr:pyridoxamine 5'-phosphate oxidase family protein [Oceanicola granulosus]EAR50942.1 hypothetical protein OG2516_13756 [Oceanicola granulosus HTCC2516]
MSDTSRLKEDAKGQLFDELARVHAGMLAIDGAGQHFQPMTPYCDRDTGVIWFISSRETDLVRTLSGAMSAHFNFIGKDDDYWACMSGRLEQVEDEAKIDEIWNAVAAAWFEEGREDHDVCLLRFSLDEAAIWASSTNPITFGFQIAKANMSHDTANLGDHRIVSWT